MFADRIDGRGVNFDQLFPKSKMSCVFDVAPDETERLKFKINTRQCNEPNLTIIASYFSLTYEVKQQLRQ